jgi:hypothetical protein
VAAGVSPRSRVTDGRGQRGAAVKTEGGEEAKARGEPLEEG